MTVTKRFVSWAWDLDTDAIPDSVLESAGLHLLDGLGTALAGRRSRTVDYAIAMGRAGGGPHEATILGDIQRVAAPWAAFANGVLAHALDYDDTHTGGLVHATAVTLPAMLAVGEQFQRPGTDLLVAAVIGYELVARLGLAAPHGFHTRGFHATSVCGTFAAALVASRLAGLNHDEAVAALGIAGSQAAGSMEFLSTGSSTKQIHPGWASLSGIVAARLAALGATGPDSTIEGNRGLFRLFTDIDVDPAEILSDLGATWETERISIKPYPACHLIHHTLDAARAAGQIDWREVAEVVVAVPPESVPIVCEPAQTKLRPRSAYDAKFSAQWSVAAMLVDGDVTTDTYEESQIARPELLRLAGRVRYESYYGDEPAAEAPGAVTVVLQDGTRRTGSSAGGSHVARTSRQSIIDKFHANVGGDVDSRSRLIELVLDLPSARGVYQVHSGVSQLLSGTPEIVE